ncbi:MAG: pyruvate:ferredoxin (flavodoxin) oxidoreductase [Eubacteriales bacterium]
MSQNKMKTMDGNTAAAYVSYAFTEVAAIYPITPSSTMAELVDEWSAYGKTNIFGQKVAVAELQSEGGAAGTVHGSLAAGALTTTFTASQGLLLMIPNMYKIAGELLPGVFHVSARTLATHALCIFGDHSDVMATRQTGFTMLASSSVQEVMDLAGIAHLSAIKSSVPVLHFFDGFRTSHEEQKVEVIDYEDFKSLIDMEAVQRFRDHALNPEHPVTRGSAQNPDIFFQAREAANKYYEAVPGIVVDYMNKLGAITGRSYKPFDYVGHKDAEHVIVAMGSVCETAEETIQMLLKQGKKVGLLKVRLFRPFISDAFKEVLPKTVKKIAVLDRTKEPGALGDPLYMDIRSIFYGDQNQPIILGGRYGLGSKDTTPAQIVAVFNNLEMEEPKDHFTIGINDDVTFKSLEIPEGIITEPEGTIRCKFWGLGSDGTVGANKSSIKIIGDKTELYAQGYFDYDSKKSGGLTVSHLRFGENKIQSTYLIAQADFVACHTQSYVYHYDLLKGLRKGGTFLLNCLWDGKELEEKLPSKIKRYIAENEINFYTIDATSIGIEIGLGSRINMIMQAAFFKLSGVIPVEEAVKFMKESVKETYGKKGGKIIVLNECAIDRGITDIKKFEIPKSWAELKDEEVAMTDVPKFITDVLYPVSRQEGNSIPVSAFADRADGTFPQGTSSYEKRAIAVDVPSWIKENCIQCNQCSFVCPHATIRPILLNKDEKDKAPATFETIKANGKGFEDIEFRIQVAVRDCIGCGNCADICPAKEKALAMKHIATQDIQIKNWEYAVQIPVKDKIISRETVKGSQLAQPYLEFSGACGGCGETPYIKLVTQLFGDRMMIANATGCSSIWGASAPSTPYCKDKDGRGPSWANSLFEDNAEYGYGMAIGVKQIRNKVSDSLAKLVKMKISEELKDAIVKWIETKEDGTESRIHSDYLLTTIEKSKPFAKAEQDIIDDVLNRKDFLVKKSIWALGGDGWAYDIGYGGLDHVLASGENINVLVFDTEMYSNTGGQASKATPTAAIAKFAASGKSIKKKDLGMMAISYGYVYVAQVGMGADKNQLIKAITEAEKFDGPSIIIAYAPCISHGIKKGMGKSQENTKDAVEAGYWHLYRFNPDLKKEGKNPFILDSKPPTKGFEDFLLGQVRYSSLKGEFPDIAGKLFKKAEVDANDRYESYLRLTDQPKADSEKIDQPKADPAKID